MILISIFSLAFSTDPYLRRPITNCERLKHMQVSRMKGVNLVKDLLQADCDGTDIPDGNGTVRKIKGKAEKDDYVWVELPERKDSEKITSSPPTTTNKVTSKRLQSKSPLITATATAQKEIENTTWLGNSSIILEAPVLCNCEVIDALQFDTSKLFVVELPKVKIPDMRIPFRFFRIMEGICLIYFSIDLFLRLTTCPSLRKYLMSVVNIMDILALSGSYSSIIILFFLSEETTEQNNWLKWVQFLQMLRSLRLFRCVEGFKISKVLAFSLTENLKDVLIMVFYMIAGMCVFSAALYVVEPEENVKSIPEGMYWTIVTMTTVGYGDIVPKTMIGRIIGSVCAISGVLMFAFVVPLVVNHFLNMYQYVNILDDPGHDGAVKHDKNESGRNGLTFDGKNKEMESIALNII